MSPIELTEYLPRPLPPQALSAAAGARLWRDYGRQIAVDFPSPATDGRWRLTNRGWAGYIPLDDDVHIHLHPKVQLANLFQMLEVAYQFDRFQLLDGLYDTGSLPAFYDRLAGLLASRVLVRARQGFHRAYLPRAGRLPYVRGRLDIRQTAAPAQAAAVRLHCAYEEHTADIADNQILAWTLRLVARSGLCSQRTLPAVRRAYRAAAGIAAPRPFAPADCIDRPYHRLNQDYRPMHALCRFFLEHSGPRHQFGDRHQSGDRRQTGDHRMLPFLIDMAALYEAFVAEWLRCHAAGRWSVAAQERHRVGGRGDLSVIVDLVLRAPDGRRLVLDTKYKLPDRAANPDVYQVVTYAKLKDASQAILIYPRPLRHPLDVQIGDIRVRSLPFPLDGDLDANGRAFLANIQQSTANE